MVRALFVVVIFIGVFNCEAEIFDSNKDPTCGIIKAKLTNYIYGGKSTHIEQWPWQLHMNIAGPESDYLGHHAHASCGGSLISDNWIITAAHCFTGRESPKIYILSGSNFTKNANYKLLKYEKIHIHPNYVEYTGTHEFSTNDIALIKLSPESRFPKFIATPCLPKKNAIIPVNSLCYITGFGSSSQYDREPIKRIKEGKVAIKHDRVCVKSLALNEFDSDTMMCAGRAHGIKANSCQGDSGGPLVCEGNFGDSSRNHWYIFGITSFGAQDCASYTSSVYTKVSTYVDWIQLTMAGNHTMS